MNKVKLLRVEAALRGTMPEFYQIILIMDDLISSNNPNGAYVITLGGRDCGQALYCVIHDVTTVEDIVLQIAQRYCQTMGFCNE